MSMIEYAIIGARQERQALMGRIEDIDNFLAKHAKSAGSSATGPSLEKIRKIVAKKRSTMSPAARKAVSTRMKKYWADRRKAKMKKS